MNAQTLAEVFDAVYLREFSEFDAAPKHFFSFKHRRAMKKILFPQGVSSFTTNRRLPIKKRIIIVMLVILLSLLGIAAGAQISRGFAFDEIGGHTYLFAVNDKNAPETIETQYHLPTVPEGFEPIYEDIGEYNIFIQYHNDTSEIAFFFNQSVKNGFSVDLKDLTGDLEEIKINERPAYYFACGDIFGAIVWNNKDYILEVGGYFTKDELIALAESVESKAE